MTASLPMLNTALATDRELLELAAKAAGFGSPHKTTGKLQFCWTESEYPPKSGKHGALWNFVGHMETAELWNPLADDGDALRLAVALGINVFVLLAAGISECRRLPYQSKHRHGGDPKAATRRAITLCAAEIGKDMS